MRARGVQGSVVTLLCDAGERYAHTYYSDAWVSAQGFDLDPYRSTIGSFLDGGDWREPEPVEVGRGAGAAPVTGWPGPGTG